MPKTPEEKKTKQDFSLFPLVPFSGCRAVEPVSLTSALHHLRRLGRGGGPVVHAQRHQLAAPSDSLSLQCKSTLPSNGLLRSDCRLLCCLAALISPPSFWLSSCLLSLCSCDFCGTQLWWLNKCMSGSMSRVTSPLRFDLCHYWSLSPLCAPPLTSLLLRFWSSSSCSLCSLCLPLSSLSPSKIWRRRSVRRRKRRWVWVLCRVSSPGESSGSLSTLVCLMVLQHLIIT